MDTTVAVGIDVGACRLHLVSLETSGVGQPEVCDTAAVASDRIGHVVDRCRHARRVAIDAPAQPSVGAHRADPDRRLSGKFRPARCGEIAAGEQFGVWVPWVTPLAGTSVPTWMAVGFELWAAVAGTGATTLETYPAGSFWLASGRRWPPVKTSPAGRRRRLALLEDHLRLPSDAGAWSHHTIDAAMAALVAVRGDPSGRAAHAAAGCDGSSMWLFAGGGATGRAAVG